MRTEALVHGATRYMTLFVNRVTKRKETVVNENRAGEGGLGRINSALTSPKSFRGPSCPFRTYENTREYVFLHVTQNFHRGFARQSGCMAGTI